MNAKSQKRKLLFPIQKTTSMKQLTNSDNTRNNFAKTESTKLLIYKPIHPKYPFNSSTLGLDEILKPQTISLIKDYTLKNIIIKFCEEQKKLSAERKLLFHNQSTSNMKKNFNEKNNNITNKNEKNSPNKLPKISKNMSFNNNSINNLNLSSNTMTINNSSLNNKNKRKKIWNKDIGHKSQEKKSKNLSEYLKRKMLKLKRDVKIRGAYCTVIKGTINPMKISGNNYRKISQHLCFSNLNINSKKLGPINLFGIFEGNGPHGKAIATLLKNYLLKYFEKSTEMKVTQKKNNYYSIMYDSFVNAQKYLQNQKNYNTNNNYNYNNSNNINPEFSGATGIILLYPNNLSNKIYCANIGKCKCLLYTSLGTVKLSYEFSPKRASEKDRIEEFKKQFSSQFKEKEKKNKEIDMSNEENKNDNNRMRMSSNNDSASAEKIKKLLYEEMKNNLIKKLEEMDLSRCFGNFAAKEIGIIPDPEVVECDIRINRGKFIVAGTVSLWKYISDEEIGLVVSKHLLNCDCLGACKDLEDLARERWQLNERYVEDISVLVIFFGKL